MDGLFEYYFEDGGIHLKYAKGEPAVKEQEFHDYHEFVFFISGRSYIISKNIQQELLPGSIVIIPREQYHQFVVSEPDEYVRCILGFREDGELRGLIGEVMDTVKIIEKPEERVLIAFGELIEAVKGDMEQKEKLLFLKATLVRILVYLRENTSSVISQSISLSPVVRQALGIIDKNYAEPISVENIAEQLYVCPSTLAHKFRNELNISVYQYITKKRLFEARYRIEKGEDASKAASACGFSDYSCFYRLYRKFYGKSPSEDK